MHCTAEVTRETCRASLGGGRDGVILPLSQTCWEADEDGSDSDTILLPRVFAALGLPELEAVCICVIRQ